MFSHLNNNKQNIPKKVEIAVKDSVIKTNFHSTIFSFQK